MSEDSLGDSTYSDLELSQIESLSRWRRHLYHSDFQNTVAAAGGPICNLCGSSRFKDRRERVKARCAGCGGVERARLMKMHLEHYGRLRSGIRILHFAPEKGLYNLIVKTAPARYVVCDINTERYARKGITAVSVDLCGDLSAIAGSYDIILHSHVLEHLKCNYAAVVLKLNTLLAPGGRHIFQIPIMPGHFAEDFAPVPEEKALERRGLFGQNSHLRRFGREDMESTLGMLFDFAPYREYDVEPVFGRQQLLRHNVPTIFWRGMTSATVFDIAKESFI